MAAHPAKRQGCIAASIEEEQSLLALLEHWFMVLPLPDQKLWRWMLPEAPTAQATKHDT